MKDIASALARLNELGRPDLAEPIQFLMGERDGLMKALTSAKTVIESKDKAYSLIQQRWDAMQAKASTVDSERACNEMLTAEVDELRSRVVELERERDQLALSLSATRAERDHAVRSAELWESEHRAGYEAMGVYKHLWLEGRAIMAICGYFSRMREPAFWYVPAESEDDEDALVLPARNGTCPSSYETKRAFPLYAGSAPVPAEQMDNPNVMTRATAYARDIVTWLHRDHYADNTQFEPFDDLLGLLSQIDNMICGWKEQPAVQEVDVDAICNAYESGVGHRGRPTANVNPYREGTPEHEAYAIGARGEAAQAETKVSVGDSRFESWFAQYNPSGKGDKQRARDAYAAGMSDPAEAKMADALVQDAWTFVYEPETNFVGAYHTSGGKQSICEITNPTYRYELGVRIAELLNTYGIGNGAMLAAKAKGGGK